MKRIKWFAPSTFIIGSIIGAGFASGKEVQRFFTFYGISGIITSVLSGLLFVLIFRKLFDIGIKTQSTQKQQSKLLEVLLAICFIIVSSTMLSGIEGLAFIVSESIIVSKLSNIAICIITYLVVIGGMKTILKVSSIIAPFLIIFIVAVSIYLIISNKTTDVNSVFSLSQLIQSLLLMSCYVFMNVLLASKGILKTAEILPKKTQKISSLISAIFISSLIVLVNIAITKSPISITQSQMPFVEVVNKFGFPYNVVSVSIIVLAIFSTLIASIYSLNDSINLIFNISQKKNNYITVCALLIFVSLILSQFGFENLINYAFPVQGLIGFVYFVSLYLTHKRTKKA